MYAHAAIHALTKRNVHTIFCEGSQVDHVRYLVFTGEAD